MGKFITLSHPDVEQNPRSFMSADVQPGAQILYVKNTAGFTQGDYILIGKYRQEQAEIVPIISAVTYADRIVIGAPKFGHPADTEVTKMDFNQFKVYRSIMGVGGFYDLIDTKALQVDSAENIYEDKASVYPFSYRHTYYNDATKTETDFGPEVPFAGLPFYCLGELTRRTLSLYGDKKNEYIDKADIRDWLNECTERLSFEILGGDSPYSLNSAVLPLTITGNTFDMSKYSVIEILLVEYSRNGIDYSPIDGNDVRHGGAAMQGAGFTFVGSNIAVSGVGTTGYVRVWYATNPILMEEDTDVIPLPFQGHTRIYVDWALQRAHESDRQVAEMGAYYFKKLEMERMNVITRLRSRIKGNKTIATPWAYSFGSDYGL